MVDNQVDYQKDVQGYFKVFAPNLEVVEVNEDAFVVSDYSIVEKVNIVVVEVLTII